MDSSYKISAALKNGNNNNPNAITVVFISGFPLNPNRVFHLTSR
jgi:hypothetical protein